MDYGLLLIPPLSLSIASAVLAALIYLTDKIVNNYGTCTLDINASKKELSVTGGSPLMFTLAEQKIFVPSACGGRGSCGACKVKIKSDIGPILPTELPYLTKEEKEQNIRLSCQIKVKQDLQLEIPEEIFNVQRLEGTITGIKDVTYDIKEVQVEIPEAISFFPGQYEQFETPKYKHNKKTHDTTMRAYSLSSPVHDSKKLEFLIRLVPDGIVTTYVHEYLQEGQKINVIGPFGDFYVRDTDAKMICVAGGSGMAPFRSIFKTMIKNDTITKREIWYFFGARAVRDLYYVDWLEELDKKYENFHFVPALSDPLPEDNWSGPTGLITEILDGYLKKDIKRDKELEGYLCGSPGMLDACMAVMGKNNMSSDRIFYDKFA